MATGDNRILTTHVGSLVRPPELTRYIEAIDRGEAVDQTAFDRCLADSVRDVVRRQAQAGIDIVSDGEFGKFRSWSFYVLDRLAGIEEREVEDGARGRPRPADVSGILCRIFSDPKAAEARHRGLRRAACIQGPGRGCEGYRDLQGRPEGYSGGGCVSAGGRSGERGAAPQERILQKRRGVSVQARRSPARGIPRDRRCRTDGADRRCVPALHVRRGLRRRRHRGLP